MKNYKSKKVNSQIFQIFEEAKDKKETEDFNNLCNHFLEVTNQQSQFSEMEILMDFCTKIRNGLSIEEKNLFFAKQIHLVLLYFFLNPNLLSEDTNAILPLLFITLYEQHELDCEFLLAEEFVNKLIIEATTYPNGTGFSQNAKVKRFLRVNKLLRIIIKRYHAYIPIPFTIQRYCLSLSTIHHFEFLQTFRKIIQTNEATFESCKSIFPYLNILFDEKNNNHLERLCYAKLMITLIQKGNDFMHLFFECIEIQKLFQLLINDNDDLELVSEVFKLYTVILNSENADYALIAFNQIDQSKLFSRIKENTLNNSDSLDINIYYISVCNFYQSIFRRFPQVFNNFNPNLFIFFFNLCTFQYKIKIEAIYALCFSCTYGPTDLIPLLVNGGIIDQIVSIIDECQSTIVLAESIKKIVNYSVVTNNEAIQNQIFQDYFMNTMNNIVQKPEFAEIANIWNSILKMKE